MGIAVKITKEAKNCTFDNCDLHGRLENSGQNMKFIKTRFNLKEFGGNHPVLYGSISAVIGGVITLVLEYVFFK